MKSAWVKPFYGAIDQGTSSSRFILYDSLFNVVGFAQKALKTEYKEMLHTQDPNEILSSVYECIERVMQESKVDSADVSCIGLTNQRETTIIFDESGEHLYPAILWSDTRNADICKDLINKEGQDALREETGLPISTYFSATKLSWLYENERRLFDKEVLFGTVDTFLLYHLTGEYVTDVSNASRTLMMDIKGLCWSQKAKDLLNVPSNVKMAKIVSSSHKEAFGKIRKGALKGVPVTGVLGDQQSALLGHRGTKVGDCKATFGTGCFVLMNVGQEVK